jgi:hypothetical protein
MRTGRPLPRGDSTLSNNGERAALSWICPRCGEAVKEFVALQEHGSMVEAKCLACHYGVQIRAFVTEEAEGGKPGTGKGHF